MSNLERRRYRWAALVWCLQAVDTATPKFAATPDRPSRRTPAQELKVRLTRTLNSTKLAMPLFEDLTTPQPFALVETWRQIAKAAVLAEHDFAAVRGRLTDDERDLVLTRTPRWSPAHSSYLTVATATSPAGQQYANPDAFSARPPTSRTRPPTTFSSVTGSTSGARRAPSALIEGGPDPGFEGVLQAQHNMLVHLSRPPNALNLRRVLHSQRLISHESARRAQDVAPNLIDNWLERERTYQHLVAETRNLTGLLGNGSPAAAEAANAVTRFERLNADDITCNPERFRDLNQFHPHRCTHRFSHRRRRGRKPLLRPRAHAGAQRT